MVLSHILYIQLFVYLFYSCYKIPCGFFIIKPTRYTNFRNLFCHETLHVSDSSSAHHQEVIHCTLSNGVCYTGSYTAVEQDQDGTPDDGQTNCPKHVAFHDKINL